MSVQIDLNTKDYEIKIRSVQNASNNFTRAVIQELTPVVEEEFIRTVPVDSGDLRDSITSIITDENSSRVQTNTAGLPDTDGYAKAVDQGKRAVTITAKGKINGGADFLRFKIDGRTFFRRSVFIPEQQGQFFGEKTIENVKPKIPDVLVQVWNSLI